jgi:hypothetical protein
MSWSPTTVPRGTDATVYLVLDSFGAIGAAYRETDIERSDLETVISRSHGRGVQRADSRGGLQHV